MLALLPHVFYLQLSFFCFFFSVLRVFTLRKSFTYFLKYAFFFWWLGFEVAEGIYGLQECFDKYLPWE